MPSNALDGVRVLRQGVELPVAMRRIDGQIQVVAEWTRTGAGSYLIEATDGDRWWYATTVVEPQKITQHAFAHLVTELQSRLPAAVAIDLQRGGALSGLKILEPEQSTIEAELLRLRRAVLGLPGRIGLAQGLPAIADSPHSIFVGDEVWVERQLARRVQPQGLRAALAKPYNLDAERKLLRVPDMRAEHSVDVYENRLVRTYWDQVNERLRRVMSALERGSNPPAFSEATDLLGALTRARRQASFLDEVQRPTHLTATVTMVLLKRPEYRAMFEGYLELHRSAAVRIDDPALESPLENLPRLYQLWATLHVIHMAVQVATSLGFTVTKQSLVRQDSQGLFIKILPDGSSAVTLVHERSGTRVAVIPEKSYSRSSSPISTISYTQRPDVVVDARRPSGRHTLLIFDPKYKLKSEYIAPGAGELDDALEEADSQATGTPGRPKKVDIDKMHAYRDAIQADHRRVVEYAAILYPGGAVRYGDAVAALPAYPTREYELDDALRGVIYERLSRAMVSDADSATGTLVAGRH